MPASVSGRIFAVTGAFFALEYLLTLVVAPRCFFPALFTGPPGIVLQALGASSTLVWQGQWWGVWTATFLHGGVLHLLFNLMALSFIARLMESLTSSWFLLLTYLLSGATGFLLSSLFGYLSVGASGALYGLIGCGIVVSYLRGGGRHDPLFTTLVTWAVIGLLFGFVIPNVDNAAHLGGLLSGGVMGLVWTRHSHSRVFVRLVVVRLAQLFSLITAAGFVFSLLTYFPYLWLGKVTC